MVHEGVLHRHLAMLVAHRVTPHEVGAIASGAYEYADEYERASAARRGYSAGLCTDAFTRLPERRLDAQAACQLIKNGALNERSGAVRIRCALSDTKSRFWHSTLMLVLDKLRAIRSAMRRDASDDDIMAVMEHRAGTVRPADLNFIPRGNAWWSAQLRALTDADLRGIASEALFVVLPSDRGGLQMYMLQRHFRTLAISASRGLLLKITGGGHVQGQLTEEGYFYTSVNVLFDFYIVLHEGAPYMGKAVRGVPAGKPSKVLLIQVL